VDLATSNDAASGTITAASGNETETASAVAVRAESGFGDHVRRSLSNRGGNAITELTPPGVLVAISAPTDAGARHLGDPFRASGVVDQRNRKNVRRTPDIFAGRKRTILRFH
jgi:hypothetical protein